MQVLSSPFSQWIFYYAVGLLFCIAVLAFVRWWFLVAPAKDR